MLKEAKQQIENLSPLQVAEEMKNDNVILIDIREPFELEQHGAIEGSIHAVRGGLELFADPAGQFYNRAFDPAKRIILHCAGGTRSALSVLTLKQMGYPDVVHMEGGLNAWKEHRLPVKSTEKTTEL